MQPYQTPQISQISPDGLSALALSGITPNKNIESDGYPIGCPLCGSDGEYLPQSDGFGSDGRPVVLVNMRCEKKHEYALIFAFTHFVFSKGA